MLVSFGNPVDSENDAPAGPAGADAWRVLRSPVEPFMDDVRRRLEEQAASFEPEIASCARYALANQGKQIRPFLVALAGDAAGGYSDGLAHVAVIIEMVHLATLVHDDIMDEASVRRGRPTVSSRWGSDLSVLLGDCLFARALELAADYPTTDVCRHVSRATRRVCSGEIIQTLRYRRHVPTRDEYFRTLRMKTAELFALSCHLGGLVSGKDPAACDALTAYGLALGTAYQVYDDCLDIFGVEDQAGKSLGTDLMTGKITLPVLLLLESVNASEREAVQTRVLEWREQDLAWLLRLLERHQCLDSAVRVVRQFLKDADAALLAGDGAGLEALRRLPTLLDQEMNALRPS